MSLLQYNVFHYLFYKIPQKIYFQIQKEKDKRMIKSRAQILSTGFLFEHVNLSLLIFITNGDIIISRNNAKKQEIFYENTCYKRQPER